MNKTFYFYFLAVLIIATAIISGKSEILKMQHSEKEVDALFFKIDSSYHKQIILVQNLNKYMEISGIIFPDSITREPPVERSGIKVIPTVSFHEFMNHETLQNAIDVRIDSLLRFISTIDRQMKKEEKPLVRNIYVLSENIVKLKENYNEKARLYNSFIKTFPRNLYSILFHFQTKPYFQLKKGMILD